MPERNTPPSMLPDTRSTAIELGVITLANNTSVVPMDEIVGIAAVKRNRARTRQAFFSPTINSSNITITYDTGRHWIINEETIEETTASVREAEAAIRRQAADREREREEARLREEQRDLFANPFDTNVKWIVVSLQTGGFLHDFSDLYSAIAFASEISARVAGARSPGEETDRVEEYSFYSDEEPAWPQIAREIMLEDGISFTCTNCQTQTGGEPERTGFWCGDDSNTRVALCTNCVEEINGCGYCGRFVGQGREVVGNYGPVMWGEYCVSMYASECPSCNRYAFRDEMPLMPGALERSRCCSQCWIDSTQECCCCHNRYPQEGMHTECICVGCAMRYFECSGCGNPEARERMMRDPDDEDSRLCRRCARGISLRRTVESSLLSGSVHDSPIPQGLYGFGIEVEAEWRGEECPFPYGGYHSNTPASHEFFSGWRAERDGSVEDGAEFISPPLQGAEGLAETIATFRVLKDSGAKSTRKCGQHTTVMTSGYPAQIEVQRLTMALEEAMLALTGSFRRVISNVYAPRFKSDSYYRSAAKEKMAIPERRIAAGIKPNNLIEFRYPPGTLSPEQLCINVGLCRLVCMLADNLQEREIEDLVEESLAIDITKFVPLEEKIHNQVKLGLEFFSAHGWRTNHPFMSGLPYDVTTTPHYHLVDERRELEAEVALPPAVAIVRRMERQLTRFYERMGANAMNRGRVYAYASDLAEALAILKR